jgi:hypothetical protein
MENHIVPTINQELINAIKEEEEYQNGDIYDEDLGEYLATIDLKGNEEKVETLPARLSLFMHGYWYIFTPVGRYKEEKDKEKADAKVD